MIDLEEIRRRVAGGLPNATVDVGSDGYYVSISVTSDEFEGVRPVRRQQMVYATINDLIASGDLHAVNLTTRTPNESAG